MSLYIPLSWGSSSRLHLQTQSPQNNTFAKVNSDNNKDDSTSRQQCITKVNKYNHDDVVGDIDSVNSSREQHQHGDFIRQPSYLLRRCVRGVVCGLLFAIPIGFLAPHSPAMMLSAQDSQRRVLTIRIVNDFFRLCFCTSALSYCMLIEPFADSTLVKKSFVPYLGPVTAQIPAFSCLCASHLYFPGLAALFYQPTWRTRFRVFARLNFKCFLAYSTVHVPATIAIGCIVGVLMLPFKMYKQRHNPR